MKFIVSVQLIILFTIPFSIVQAQWSGNASAPTIVSNAANSQNNQLQVPNGTGGTVTAWMDLRNGNFTNFNYDIYMQNVTSSGTMLWAGNGLAVCTAPGEQFLNDLKMDAAGNIFVTWEDGRNATDGDVYIQKFNSSGVAQWAANGIKVATAIHNQEDATLVPDGAGGVFATWADLRNDPANDEGYQAFAQRFDANGNALWTANGIKVVGGTSVNYPTEIVSDGAGSVIISLIDGRNSTIVNGDYINLDVYAQKLSASGAALWGANGVAVVTQTSNQYIGPRNLVSDGSGGAIFSWLDYRNDPSNGLGTFTNGDLFAQRLNASGVAQWASNGIPIFTGTGDSYSMFLLQDGAGGAIAFWEDVTATTNSLMTQRINSAGTALWTNTVTTASSTTGVDIALDNNGGVIFTWGQQTNPSVTNIYAQKLAISTGAKAWGIVGAVVATGTQLMYGPTIATNALGEAIIAWEDYRNISTTDSDIYANKIGAAGTLPVMWGAISGILKGKDAIISFETLQEYNSAQFTFERSMDGVSFTSFASINAAGNSTTKKIYSITDVDVATWNGKTIYYRVKQTDIDGKHSYSTTVMIKIPKSGLQVKMLTNPVLSTARLSFLSNENGIGYIRLVSMQGTILLTLQQSFVEGMNQISIPVNNLPAGNYLIELQKGNFKQTINFVKQ